MLEGDVVADAAIAMPLGASRVLVVDDEEPVVVTVRGVLELDGYEITATTSGSEALDLIRAEHFDVVLTDLHIDDIGGVDLLSALREQDRDASEIGRAS